MSAVATDPPGEPHRFDIFLSYNSDDLDTVSRIADHLQQRGLRVWFDKWRLTPGGNWMEELTDGMKDCAACAIFIGRDNLGAWTRQEMYVALNRAAADRRFRVFPVLLPGLDPFQPEMLPPLLGPRSWVDMREGSESERSLAELRCAVLGLPPGPGQRAVSTAEDVCPYRGLEVFQEADAPYYFGRKAAVQRLVEKLKASRFLAVVGPSGSGKSSLVRAGLVPRLRGGALPASAEWHVALLRPGAHPLAALAGAMRHPDPAVDPRSLVDGLAADRRTLHIAAATTCIDRSPDHRDLLVVDQCEEVFTLCRDDGQRAAFFANLHYAAAIPGGPVAVVITLRADFYSRLAAFPDLAQLATAQQVLLGGLTEDELRQVVEEPAWAVGLDIEPGLVETIVSDVVREAGTLPLLEHALLETWRRRHGGILTVRGYHDGGGVARGLADRAEACFQTLGPAAQELTRHLFLRLTQPGEGTEDTRRRVAVGELVTEPEDELVEQVVGRFVTDRLLTTSADPDGGETYVEVSHEALFTAWPRFLTWIGENRAGLLVHRSLTFAAQEWRRLDHDPGALLRGGRLAEVERWYEERSPRLNDVEREFLSASQVAAAAARRARRRNVVAIIATLLVVLVVVGVAALVAMRQRDLAVSRELAASAQNTLTVDPALSLALALHAAAAADTVEGEQSLRTATHEAHGLAVLRGGGGLVRSVRYLPGGHRAVAAGDDGQLRVWDLDTGQVHDTVPAHTGPVFVLRPTLDGREVASVGGDGVATLTDLTDRWTRPVFRAADGRRTTALAVSRDGRWIAVGTDDGTVAVVDPSGNPRFTTKLADGTVYDAAFSPDGRVLVTAGPQDVAHVLDATTGATVTALPGHGGAVLGVAVAPSGDRIVTSDERGAIRFWDPTGGLIDLRQIARQAIYRVGFSDAGSRLVASGEDAVVRVLSADGIELAALRGHARDAFDASFDPAGNLVISGGLDGTVRTWRVGDTAAVRTPVTGMSLSPDGHRVAVDGPDGMLRIRSVDDLTEELAVADHAGRSWPTFAPDGTRLVSAGEDGWVEVRDAADGRSLARFQPHSGGAVWSAVLNPTNTLVASGGRDGRVVLSSLAGAPARTVAQHRGQVYAVKFSPDGQTVLSGGEDGVTVLSGPDWSRTFPADAGAIADVAFSRDGRLVASAYDDGSVRVWDQAGTSVAVLRGHAGGASALQFAPSGTQLVTAGGDGQVRVWDLASSQLRLAEQQFEHAAAAVAVGPEGTRLVSASEADAAVRVSSCDVCGDLPTVLALARSRAIRALTPEEEQTFLN